MKVLLTGATGNLGYATVRELETQGYEIVALVRATSNLKGLDGTSAVLAYGDVLDKTSVKTAAQGCDAIIHQAAVFSVDMSNPDEIIKPAVEGARNVLEVAHELGIKRVVYTSSIISIGMSDSPDKILDGNSWNTNTALPYAVAKTKSEQIATEIAKNLGIELMILCPGGITGPGDYRITPTHAMLIAMLKGQTPIRAGGQNPVSVFDVASLHVQALTKGVPFKRYVAASYENITYQQIFSLLADIVGEELPEPPQGDSGPVFYAYYDIRETCADFDYHPKSARETIESAVEWFKSIAAC